MKLVDADALYNGSMKKEYFSFVEHDNHGRESFAYSCAMQRLVEAPTIEAISVEWLRAFCADDIAEDQQETIEWMLKVWKQEQEAR